jgi:hypothetical protein
MRVGEQGRAGARPREGTTDATDLTDRGVGKRRTDRQRGERHTDDKQQTPPARQSKSWSHHTLLIASPRSRDPKPSRKPPIPRRS